MVRSVDSKRVKAVAFKMPATERDVWGLVQTLAADATFAFIEKVGAMPGQGVTSMFSFGRSYGFLRACLTAADIPWGEVTPGVWQRSMGCLLPKKAGQKKGPTSTEKKNHNKGVAQRLFPDLRITRATADALLIAEYGRRGEVAIKHE